MAEAWQNPVEAFRATAAAACVQAGSTPQHQALPTDNLFRLDL